MGVGWAEGQMEREKGEGEDWGYLVGMGWLTWRKGGYGIREEDILTKEVILGLPKDLALEEFPGVQGDFPS